VKSSETIGTFLKKSAVVCLRSRPHYGPSADPYYNDVSCASVYDYA